MRFGTVVWVERGGDHAPKGKPDCRRFVLGVLIGAHGRQRRVRLLQDDPLDTVGWNRTGQIGAWSASAVREARRRGHDWAEMCTLFARKRRCKKCGAEQTREDIQSWGRIVAYRWYPLAGRCKGQNRYRKEKRR